MLRRQLLTGLRVTLTLTVLLGILYPAAVTGVAQLAFPTRANGTLITRRNAVVGSGLLGQSFSDASGHPIPTYFQPRPSAAGKAGYEAGASGGSNLGPSDPSLIKTVAERVTAYRDFNRLAPDAPVPVDAVTASGSGLDPDISPANAYDQLSRVSAARHIDPARVRQLIDLHRNRRPWGFLGEDTVNVVALNLALDRLG